MADRDTSEINLQLGEEEKQVDVAVVRQRSVSERPFHGSCGGYDSCSGVRDTQFSISSTNETTGLSSSTRYFQIHFGGFFFNLASHCQHDVIANFYFWASLLGRTVNFYKSGAFEGKVSCHVLVGLGITRRRPELVYGYTELFR